VGVVLAFLIVFGLCRNHKQTKKFRKDIEKMMEKKRKEEEIKKKSSKKEKSTYTTTTGKRWLINDKL
jgi:uncharacterized membrane protein YgaE (UPF0421/DUF939 family)